MRSTRDRSTALTRLTGVAILLMAATVWPMAVFAADPAVETKDNAVVVFTVIVLLFGSVAAGLFFASPLRRRVTASPPNESDAQAPAANPFTTEPVQLVVAPEPLVAPQPLVAQSSSQAQPAAAWPNPSASAQLLIPPPSAAQTPIYIQVAVTTQPPHNPAPSALQAPLAADHRPVASPWSTGRPQPDANWNPDRHRVS